MTEAGMKGYEGGKDLQERVHIFVDGRVQGVFFRKTMMDLARNLGVTGWVRNLKNGSVEAVVEGERRKLEEIIEFCHAGPQGARVSKVTVEWSLFRGEFRNFRILH